MVNIVWAFSSLLYLRKDVMELFVAEARGRLEREDFNAQQLSNLIWALCISQVLASRG